MKRLFFVVGFGLVCAGCLPPAQARSEQKAMIAASFVPDATQATLLSKARSVGATDLETAAGPDGGMIVNGRFGGRAFVLAIPARWNGEAVLFAQGYATPGSTPGVPTNPIAKDPGGGTLGFVYSEGLAIGIAAFDKSGIATESGAKNTLRLHDLVAKLGARRQYVVGGSMGGSIVMSLLELYPGAFAGAVSMCGVTEGWLPLIEQLSDMRAAYNVLTDGTAYALPGLRDVTRSALPTVPPVGDPTPGDAFREQQKMKILMPVFALFSAAKANPGGKEARIVRQVAAIGGFAPDPAAFGAPLYSAALGMDDIAATMGGQPVGNIGKSYAPPDMSAEEAANFNRRIQRFAADPKAVVYAEQWHEATGKFRVPLVTVHQTFDALVPFSQSEGLGRIVENAENGANLVQYEVPPTRFALPGGMDGYTHCGFSAEQNIAAFEAMRNWVRTGKKPGPDAVK